MYIALGFCTAGLIALAILPAFYRRAARLTEEALRAVNPSSYSEVRAAQDQERARHAVELRRVETKLEAEREKAAKFQMEASRLTADIEANKKARETELQDLTLKLEAAENDQKAADLLTAEIESLKKKLQEAETALAKSWSEPKEAETKASKTEEKVSEGSEWQPASDTMALATITGLEAEVATLKAKLAKYEPSVASELDTERSETAKSRLAGLEAQLVDTESKYIAAQAEVTRLSLQLDATDHKETDVQKRLQAELEEMSAENARQKAVLNSNDRELARLNSQMDKLRTDLSAVPQLAALRNDFQDLVTKVSGKIAQAAPQNPKTQLAMATAAQKDALKPKRRSRKTSEKTPELPPQEPVAPKTSSPTAKSANIASAADALVSRIVASNRGRAQVDKGGKSNIEGDQNTAGEVMKSSQAPKAAKQKSKDVA